LNTTLCGDVTNQAIESHIKYRPDIDGLRALAVLLVLGFHMFPQLVPGGFIGVDIFFVISGYLITYILISEQATNPLLIVNFYAKRIKRIFPALIFLFASLYIFSWFALFYDEYAHLGKHIAAGSAFIANFISWSEAGYFDSEAIRKPLLHLWSLGIEEQFYIIWPVLIITLSRFKIRLLPAFLLIFLASFLLNILAVGDDIVAAFYSPASRAWELISGAVLAYVVFSKKNFHQLLSREKANIFSLLGILVIFIGVFLINKNSSFPGWRGLLPVTGAILIITAGPNTFISDKFLSSRAMVWIGLISYPLYLWHWPIVSLMHSFLNGRPNLFQSIVITLISFLLAWITYRFIERPFRYSQTKYLSAIWLLGLMVLVGATGFATYLSNGAENRYVTSHQDLTLTSDTVDLRKIYAFPINDCRNNLNNIKNGKCSSVGTPSIAIVGDSHSEVYFRALLDSRLKGGLTNIVTYSLGSCPPALDLFGSSADCSKFTKMAMENILASKEINTVFLSSFYGDWGLGDTETADVQYMQAMNKTFSYLRDGKRKIVFIIDAPALKVSAVACRDKPLWLRNKFGWTPDFCINPTPNDFISQDAYYRVLKQLKRENPDVVFFDSGEIICPNANCAIRRGEMMIFVDDNHLSIDAARLISDDLLKKYD